MTKPADQPRRFTLFEFVDADEDGFELLRIGELIACEDDVPPLLVEYEFIPAERLGEKAKD